MKKVIWGSLAIILILVVGYLTLMVKFKEPMRLDLTEQVQLSVSSREISLPWYLGCGTRYVGKIDGTDDIGNHYTQYYYTLPDLFESPELNCIVCWETNSVIAFIGESRAMDVIEFEFPTVCWN